MLIGVITPAFNVAAYIRAAIESVIALIRATAIAEAGGFLERVAYGEDWEYWVRLALRGRFAVVPGPAPLLYVRQRRGSAYLRMATEPASFAACMDAIFGNKAWSRASARRAAPRCVSDPRRRIAGSSGVR